VGEEQRREEERKEREEKRRRRKREKPAIGDLRANQRLKEASKNNG